MATVSDALQELGITEWALRGEPTNSNEFASMFTKIIGMFNNKEFITEVLR